MDPDAKKRFAVQAWLHAVQARPGHGPTPGLAAEDAEATARLLLSQLDVPASYAEALRWASSADRPAPWAGFAGPLHVLGRVAHGGAPGVPQLAELRDVQLQGCRWLAGDGRPDGDDGDDVAAAVAALLAGNREDAFAEQQGLAALRAAAERRGPAPGARRRGWELYALLLGALFDPLEPDQVCDALELDELEEALRAAWGGLGVTAELHGLLWTLALLDRFARVFDGATGHGLALLEAAAAVDRASEEKARGPANEEYEEYVRRRREDGLLLVAGAFPAVASAHLDPLLQVANRLAPSRAAAKTGAADLLAKAARGRAGELEDLTPAAVGALRDELCGGLGPACTEVAGLSDGEVAAAVASALLATLEAPLAAWAAALKPAGFDSPGGSADLARALDAAAVQALLLDDASDAEPWGFWGGVEPWAHGWLRARLRELDAGVARMVALEAEAGWATTTNSTGAGGVARTAPDLVQLAEATVGTGLALGRWFPPAFSRLVADGVEAALQLYVAALVRTTDDPVAIPPPPPLSRWKEARFHAMVTAAAKAEEERPPPQPAADEAAWLRAAAGRWRTAAWLRHRVAEGPIAAAFRQGKEAEGGAVFFAGAFDAFELQVAGGLRAALEDAARRVAYRSSAVERAVRDLWRLGRVRPSRVGPLVAALDAHLAVAAEALDDATLRDERVVDLFAEALLAHALGRLEQALLDGGEARVFQPRHAAEIEENVQDVLDLFTADGCGLAPAAVARRARRLQDVTTLMGLETSLLTARFDELCVAGSIDLGTWDGHPPRAAAPAEDPAVFLRLLCHRGDRASSKHLKAAFPRLPRAGPGALERGAGWVRQASEGWAKRRGERRDG